MTGIFFGLITKTEWGAGPWLTEGDFASWVDEGSNLPCILYRGAQTGAWWGSVGIPDAASYYRKGRGTFVFIDPNIRCHWGPHLIGPSPCTDNENEDDPRVEAELNTVLAQFEGYLWFTFSCDKLGDYCPGRAEYWSALELDEDESDFRYSRYYMKTVHRNHPGNYKDMDFAKNECKKLARQLARVKEENDRINEAIAQTLSKEQNT